MKLCRTFHGDNAIPHAAMKSVRFSQVVAKCGRPETLLLLMDPKKDRALQAAVKAQRVMTLMQSPVRTKTDWGEAGFHPGSQRQYLLFPKSLAAYAGKAIIGIKYELLSEALAPRHHAAPPAAKPARKASSHPKPLKAAKPAPPPEKEETEPPPHKEKQKEEKKTADAPEVARMKRQVKKAMQALEKGRQVAAFNLLQIVDD